MGCKRSWVQVPPIRPKIRSFVSVFFLYAKRPPSFVGGLRRPRASPTGAGDAIRPHLPPEGSKKSERKPYVEDDGRNNCCDQYTSHDSSPRGAGAGMPRFLRDDGRRSERQQSLCRLPPRLMPIANAEDQREDRHGQAVNDAENGRDASNGHSHGNTRARDCFHASMTRGSSDAFARRRL